LRVDCTLGTRRTPAGLDHERLAALDHRRPGQRDQQRPHRGLQQDRQTHREDRLGIQERGANQKRRIRFACTRASRRAPTSTPKPC